MLTNETIKTREKECYLHFIGFILNIVFNEN